MLAALPVTAQTSSSVATTTLSTNVIVFEQLLSSSNTVLMTNAEFRCTSGDRIFFRNDAGYQDFHAADLNSNVLGKLHLTTDQLDLQQVRLDDQKYRTANGSAAMAPIFMQTGENAPVASGNSDGDDFYSSVQKRLAASDHPADTAQAIINGINSAFDELIQNALWHGADFSQINDLEIARDKEKLKVLKMGLPYVQAQADEAAKAAQTAQKNLDDFNTDPIGYLKKTKSAAISTNSP